MSVTHLVPQAMNRLTVNVDHLMHEVNALRAENARLREQSELAFKDGLTGLRNRRYLNQRLDEEVARAQRGGGQGSMLLIDVNDFKHTNDTHGHVAGDQVLCFVAHLLQESVRASDVCCRSGGDEFVVLLPDSSEEGAQACRMRLLARLEALNEERLHKVHLAVGCASWPQDGGTAEAVMHAADMAMYRHKAACKQSRRPSAAPMVMAG